MRNYSGTNPFIATPDCGSHQLIAAELRSLIARIETSMRLIEAAMTQQEGVGDEPGSTDIFVLDDITPRYAMASAALNACRTGLDLAVQCLSEQSEPV